VDAVLRLVGLTSGEEHRIAVAVVDEGVADARARGKRGEVAGLHSKKLAVDPGVDLALDDVDELFLGRLGVGVRGARAGRDADEVDADPSSPAVRPIGLDGAIPSSLFG
jgi:hypothetical protein